MSDARSRRWRACVAADAKRLYAGGKSIDQTVAALRAKYGEAPAASTVGFWLRGMTRSPSEGSIRWRGVRTKSRINEMLSMRQRGMTQRAIAKAIGVSRVTVQKWLSIFATKEKP